MPEKTENASKMNEELRRQRSYARKRLGKLPESGGFGWRSLSKEKRVDVDRRRSTYRKVIARVDKLLGSDQKTPAKAPPSGGKSTTPGDKLIGKPVRKAAGLKPLMKTLQTAAKQGLEKKQKKNTNQD